MTDKKLECFVISPIGSPGTTTRNEADWVLRKLIHPALEDTYEIARADEFHMGQIITNKVIASIQNADLIVAVMTGHNPNVFYELAVAHCYSIPVVPLIKQGELPPFDVGFVGTIFYSHEDVTVWDAAGDQLRAAADAIRSPGYEISTPITMALGAAKATARPDSPEKMVADMTSEMATMRREIADLRSLVAPQVFENAFLRYGELHRKATIQEVQDSLLSTLHKDSRARKRSDLARLAERIIARREHELGRPLTKAERIAEAAKYYEPDTGLPSMEE